MSDLPRTATLVAIVAVLVAATGDSSFAQCPPNPQGGPSVLEITTPADGAGTDFDLGTKGTLHDAILPALKLDVCLSDCDAGANPVCTIDEIRPDPSSPGLAPPIPVNQGGLLLCAALAFPTPTPSATGTADVQSGEIALQTTLRMRIFYGNSPSSICPECVSGTCSGGANGGGACQVDANVLAGAKTFALSHSCQPSGTLVAAPSIPVVIKTATATQGACTNQSSTDVCTTLSQGTCTTTSGCTQGATGVTQECCSVLGTRSCFPPSGLSRTGTASAPAPAWGAGSQYPKTADETLVTAGCVSATGTVTLDSVVGLPGIAAMELAATTTWFATDPGPSTTTTTQPGATTTTQPGATTTTTLPGSCTPADCDDDDACTTDACTAGTCSNALAAGIPGVRCRIGEVKSHPLCTDTVDPKTGKAVTAALTKADGFLAKADGATAKKHAKFLKKAKGALGAIGKIAQKAVKKKRISAACQSTIAASVSRIDTALAAAQ